MANPTASHSQRACKLPLPSLARLNASLGDRAYDIDDFIKRPKDDDETVLYLGYGSNLSNEAFRQKRGITPLAQINVQVPELRMTLDLPGIPYKEPCFANTALRNPDELPDPGSAANVKDGEKATLLETGYHKDRWHKGLVGVVYEVTAKDFAHIIATEGGGSSYRDIVVLAHPLDADPTVAVPQNPTTSPFRAHTLFAPAIPPDEPPPEDGGRPKRPDNSYAQPSARYLKLMTDGAAERALPYEYQEYLHSIRPFRITSVRQRMGQVAFLAIWLPIVALFVFVLGRIFTDKSGRVPGWLRRSNAAIFQNMWNCYDNVFKSAFGDGERTITDGVESERSVALSETDSSHDLTGGLSTVQVESLVTKMV